MFGNLIIDNSGYILNMLFNYSCVFDEIYSFSITVQKASGRILECYYVTPTLFCLLLLQLLLRASVSITTSYFYVYCGLYRTSILRATDSFQRLLSKLHINYKITAFDSSTFVDVKFVNVDVHTIEALYINSYILSNSCIVLKVFVLQENCSIYSRQLLSYCNVLYCFCTEKTIQKKQYFWDVFTVWLFSRWYTHTVNVRVHAYTVNVRYPNIEVVCRCLAFAALRPVTCSTTCPLVSAVSQLLITVTNYYQIRYTLVIYCTFSISTVS